MRGMSFLGAAVFAVAGFSSTVSTASAVTSIERLETGEVLSEKQGSSFYVQALLDKDPEVLSKILKQDLRKLPEVFPNMALAEPFVTPTGERLLYLKMRGMGDGLGVLMQVVGSKDDAYEDAMVLDVKTGRDRVLKNARFVTVPSQVISVVSDVTSLNKSKWSEEKRSMVTKSAIQLRGPLNSVMQLPGVHTDVTLSLASYSAKGKTLSHLLIEADFKTFAPKGGELGDFRGFGERRLSLAQFMGKEFIRKLQSGFSLL